VKWSIGFVPEAELNAHTADGTLLIANAHGLCIFQRYYHTFDSRYT
jgi:hypothetical protein